MPAKFKPFCIPLDTPRIRAEGMEVGDVAVIVGPDVNPDHEGLVVLCVWSDPEEGRKNFVSLDQPNKTWLKVSFPESYELVRAQVDVTLKLPGRERHSPKPKPERPLRRRLEV